MTGDGRNHSVVFSFPERTEECVYFSSPSQVGWGQVIRSDQWAVSSDPWHFGSEAVRAGLSSRHSLSSWLCPERSLHPPGSLTGDGEQGPKEFL